jgi:sulfate permease, SulP family
MRLFASLHGYQRPWLRGDLVAGLTLWAILVPQALAYASIANVSPVVGLYAAPGALLLYAALGSSRERPAVARPARHRARGLWPARRRRA